jgi:hypothetical protein
MKKMTLLHRAMVVNRLFSYATLERQAGLSRSFIFQNLKAYESDCLIKRAGLGTKQEKLWRLTQKGKRQFDPKFPTVSFQAFGHPAKNNDVDKTVRMKFKNAPRGLMDRKGKEFPETKLWKAIRELGKFRMTELVNMKLVNKTTTYQYCAALVRAGFLRKEHKKLVSNQCVYTVARVTGDIAPVIGRALYLYDPNTDQLWDDIPARLDIKKTI